MPKIKYANINIPKGAVLSLVNQRAVKEGFPSDESKRYNGWSNWDTWETMLILDNEHETQRWLSAWCKNFNRKIKSGRFDAVKAESVVSKYLVPVARGKTKAGLRVDVPDSNIDPAKVNKAEIVKHIIEYNE